MAKRRKRGSSSDRETFDLVRFAAEVGAGSDFIEVHADFVRGFSVLLRFFLCSKRVWHLGQRCQRMSALPPKADIAQHGGNVRFVPKADISIWQWYQ